jgi:hypothetical protein
MSYLLSVIIAFPGNIWKQVEWIGWVGHSTGFPLVETGWTGFVRLRVRVVCQHRSLRRQSRRLRCQSARKSVQSIPFFCALLLRSLTANRLNRFYNRLNRFSICWPAGASPISLPFLSSLLLSSFFPSRRRLHTFLSLLHTLTTPKPTCAIQSLEVLLEIRLSRLPPSSPSILLGFLWFKLRSRYYHISFFYSISLVLDYLVYHLLGTF